VTEMFAEPGKLHTRRALLALRDCLPGFTWVFLSWATACPVECYAVTSARSVPKPFASHKDAATHGLRTSLRYYPALLRTDAQALVFA